jgi:hypothetical protein
MKQLRENIITAIKGLTRRKTIKLEHLQNIELALSNSEFDDHFWLDIFHNNADFALQEKIYTLEMVRLLTLRAIILPQTLEQFITWILVKKEKDKNHYQLSLNFQAQILNLIKRITYKAPYLSQRIDQGVLLAITLLIEKPHLSQGVFWLLQDKKRIWGKFYQDRIRQYIDYDLTLISQSPPVTNYQQFNLSDNKKWLQLWQEIANYWNTSSQLLPNPKYKSIAELFTKLQDYKIAAFFYHISLGKIPPKVFRQLLKYKFCEGFSTNIYNLTIYRYTNPLEGLILTIQKLSSYFILNTLINYLWQNSQKLYEEYGLKVRKYIWQIEQFFPRQSLIKKILFSLFYLFMWVIIYGIFLLISQQIQSELVILIPISLNLPLALLFISFIYIINPLLGGILAYFAYFFYRFIWFQDKPYASFKNKIIFRVKEFCIWIVVTAILTGLIHLLYYLIIF